MKLDVRQGILNPGERFHFDVAQAIAPQDIIGETVTFDDARMSGTYQAGEDGLIHVEGHLETVAHARCANCLKAVETPVEADFGEDFLLGGDPENDEIYTYPGGGLIDFGKLALTTALLNLPPRFLCRPDCPGLRALVARDRQVSFYEVDTAMDGLQEERDVQRPFADLQNLLAADGEP